MKLTRRQLMGTSAGCCAIPVVSNSVLGATATDEPAKHVVLLGDSIFDNQRYVGRNESVIEQLQKALPTEWQATLAAVDGHTTGDIEGQLRSIPKTATHLVVSCGGNDALGESGFLYHEAKSTAEAVLKLADIRERFARSYEGMLQRISAIGKPTLLCTIYDPHFAEAQQQRICETALCVFNDVITRAATKRGWPLIDLRILFSQGTDYANAIEPSGAGGAKLVQAICRVLKDHDFEQDKTAIYSQS